MDKNFFLINCPDLNLGGGVSSYCRSLLNHLSGSAVSFTVGSRGNSRRLLSFFKDLLLFKKQIIQVDYRLVHINPSLGVNALIRDAMFLFIAKRRQLKVLVFMHGWDVKCEQNINRYFATFFAKIFNKADAFIVLADEFRQKLKRMGIDKPIYLETTIVDDIIFTLPVPSRPASRFNILYLSRVERDKGIYESLTAFHKLKEKHPTVNLTVAGDGSELEAVKDFVMSHGITGVSFLGFIRGDYKHQAFCDADVYLFPTTYGEGMPTTVLEAMAYGLPVITRPVGGLKDFFEHEKMGFIDGSIDPAIFADYLERLAISPELRASMGQYNREYANARFKASVVAERIKNIYAEVLADA